MYFVYVLQSLKSKNRFYIGASSNLLKRLRQHNSPLNTGYTRNRKWRIVYVEGYLQRKITFHREKMLKQYGNVWHGVKRRILRTIS